MGKDEQFYTPLRDLVGLAGRELVKAMRDEQPREFITFGSFAAETVPTPTAPQTFRRSRLHRSEFVRAPYADALGETKAPLHVRQERVVPLTKTNFRVGEALRPIPDIRFAFEAENMSFGEGGAVEGSDEVRVFWAIAGIGSSPLMRLRPAAGAFLAACS